jgi:hypothetical protein
MALDLEDIINLLSGNTPWISVGRVVNQARSHLTQKTSTVQLSSDSTRHILSKHGDHLEPASLLLLPASLQNGLWIADRENSCRISYLEPESGIRYLAALKVTKNKSEVFLTTFHRAQKGQTKALLKRGKVLRNHL